MIRRALLVPAAVLVLFALLMASCRREEQKVSPATFPSAPVILISVDTLRADHLPAYGYRKVDTPNIDLLRKDSVLFRNAYAHVPLTLPSHATVLSGLLPPENGVRDNIGYRFDGSKHASIPSFLKQQGYATGAAVSSYVLRSASGLGSLFDFYDDHFDASTDGSAGNLQRAGSQTSAVAERWIDEQGRAPFFFFLHLFEPHSPYDPPEPFRSRFALPYDGEIAAADAVLGEFIQHLKDREIYDRAIVIFISDHGEDLYEHGEPEHGIFLYRDVLHVPLLVKLPGGRRAGETIDRSSGLVDIFPSICALTGFPPPERLSGRNFLGPATTAEGPRTIYAETFYPRIHLGWSELRSLIGERFHLISAPTPELYDLAADPAEKKNITSEERRQFAIMKEDLGQYGALLQSPLQADPEDEKKLAALGYIGSRQKSDTGPLPDPKEHVGEIAPMLQSMRMLDLGRIPEAIAGLRAIVKRNPGYTDAWSQLGRALETVGDYEDAVTAYETAVRLSPSMSSELGLSIGALLLKLNRLNDAAAHARLGTKVNPAGTHALLARIALARRDFPTAEQEARALISSGNVQLSGTVLLAQILSQEGKLDEALATIESAALESQKSHRGSDESLEFVKGDILARLGRNDQAIRAFLNEIDHYPHNRQAYASLAVIYALEGHSKEARQLMKRMSEANPSPSTYRFAAHTLESLGDKQAAAAWARRAAAVTSMKGGEK